MIPIKYKEIIFETSAGVFSINNMSGVVKLTLDDLGGEPKIIDKYSHTEVDLSQINFFNSLIYNAYNINNDSTKGYWQGFLSVDVGSTDRVAGTCNFYLGIYRNIAFIQTGHPKGAASSDEQKILANIFYYLAERGI